MADDRYRVVNSQEVERLFLQLMAVAEGQGRLASALRAMRWIMEELHRTPHEFGESRGEHVELVGRCAIVRPLLVEFAIHRYERVVFLRRFALVKSWPR